MSHEERFPVVAKDLDINTIEDGFVIYQHQRGKVHYLNHTAALILELCTGKNSVETIVRLVLAAFDLNDFEKEEVEKGLVALVNEGIIQYDIQPGT